MIDAAGEYNAPAPVFNSVSASDRVIKNVAVIKKTRGRRTTTLQADVYEKWSVAISNCSQYWPMMSYHSGHWHSHLASAMRPSASQWMRRLNKPERFRNEPGFHADREQRLIADREKDVREQGFALISHHDIATGRTDMVSNTCWKFSPGPRTDNISH
jgi:hypothetical protein